MKRSEISRADLEKMIMGEIRKHRECDHLLSLGFMRPTGADAKRLDQPNWAPAWLCDSPGIAPPIAFEIVSGFQEKYDLVW